MNRYVLSSNALLDLDEIWSYIAQDNVEAADLWIAELLDACETLARNPHMGHARTDITDKAILFWPVGAYLIIYRALREQVEIVAVTQGARDIPSFLRQRSQP